jgi:hypothetical protein
MVDVCHALGMLTPEEYSDFLIDPAPLHTYLALGKLASALQIRLGGVKGILVLDPSLPGMTGKHILVRPSMVKFASPVRELGVCNVSKRVKGSLNAQFINILEFLQIGLLSENHATAVLFLFLLFLFFGSSERFT